MDKNYIDIQDKSLMKSCLQLMQLFTLKKGVFLDNFDFPFFFIELKRTTTQISQEEFFSILFRGLIDRIGLKGRDGEPYSPDKASVSRVVRNKQPLSSDLVEAVQHPSIKEMLPPYFMDEVCPLLSESQINNMLDTIQNRIKNDCEVSDTDKNCFYQEIQSCIDDNEKKELPKVLSLLFIYTISLYNKTNSQNDILKRKNTRLPPEIISKEVDTENEGHYLDALLAVFSEKDGMVYSQENLNEPDFKYNDKIQRHRRDFFSAKCVERNCRDVYPKDKNQFNVFKDEIYDGIIDKYEEDYDSSYNRLCEVLSQATKVEIGKSVLMKETVWIGASERKGTCHILVNDGKLKGWK